MTHSTLTVPATPILPQSAPQPIPQFVERIEPSPLTPTEQETLQVSEAVSQQMVECCREHEAESLLEPSPTLQSPQSRSQLVMSLLDEAWGQGMTTYPQLIAYVAAQSGTGCSKRVVAQWKRERKLLDEGV